MCKRIRLSLFAVFVFGSGEFILADAPARDGEEIMEAILRDWADRRAMASAVRYEATGTITYFKGSMTDGVEIPPGADPTNPPPVPPNDFTGDASYSWTFRFDTGGDSMHAAIRRTFPLYNEQSAAFKPYPVNLVFNGSVYKEYAKDLNRVRESQMPAIRNDALEFLDNAVLAAHGYPPYGGPHAATDRSAANYAFAGHAEHNGRQCVVVRTNPFETHGIAPLIYDLYVVPERASAIVKIVYSPEGPASAIEIEYESQDDRWIPKTIRERSGSVENPFRFVDLTVTRADFDPPLDDAAFTMELPEGSYLEVENDGSYRVERDRSLTPVDHYTRTPLQPPRAKWPAVIVGVVAVLLALWAARRYVRSAN